jgi:uncharacterized alkaline shock family protein YloU
MPTSVKTEGLMLMPIQFANEQGNIFISKEVIANLAGAAALDCYGLVGMSSRKQLKDGIAEILGKDNLSRGVEIRQENDKWNIDLYIIVSYGTKISEVAYNVQERVKYILNEIAGLQIDSVNTYVQGVRVSK